MTFDTTEPIAARALWYRAPGYAELRDEPLPSPGADAVRVRTLHSAFSRGTEQHVFHGEVPPSEYQRMRAPHQSGEFPFPVKYGYAAVGTVLEGPDDLVGRTVFALHPHQNRFVLPATDVLPIPSWVPARRALLAANIETALNALWDGGALPGSRIAVIGAGVIGSLVAWLAARLPGTDVTLVDLRAERSSLAAALGTRFALPDEAPTGCDLVLHASASAAGLQTALEAAGDEATVVELSWYGNHPVAAQLGGAFHSRRLRIVGSQVGRVPPAMRGRWSHRRRLAKAIDLLDDPRLDALLEPDIRFEDLPGALPVLLARGGSALCQVVTYD